MAKNTPVEYEDRNGKVKALLETDLIGSSHYTRSPGIGTNVVELGYHPGEGSDDSGCSHSKGEEGADPGGRTIPRAPPALPVFGVDLSVEKKDGRWRVAIDFRDLNRATPKDEYPMPVAETLINAAAGHKNAGATYQRAMNYIFHDLIGKLVEIYIDDVVVKSVSMEGHLEDLRHVLDRTRKFGLRMNPKKCAFGVTAGQFLGFLVHERGIEIGLKSQEAVRTMQPPTSKKELQRLIGKINFVRRFISNLSGRIEPFMGLVKTKSDDEFHWGEQQQAFDDIKRYLTTPPVLVPPNKTGRSTFTIGSRHIHRLGGGATTRR
ncbi:hypothetical protein QYE76_027248 [Lolium multiflorum]|uniref:Reverse transcriptase domain-containing protein n=1 Tax=Lolium multiflorum TaxID=4521 RepID=A0AAD8V4T8_LOLMU|nr:hypothetical protein QYE76_027248 [Lolium multiflorum]